MAEVAFENVSKVFADGTRAVDGFDLAIEDGEFVVLVGPSGCGKTTALRVLAGLERVSEGQIVIGGRVVNDLEPRDRGIAMVFQSYALYPHLTVYENIAFGLRTRRTPKLEVRSRVAEAARTLGLDSLLARKPRQLSGGQRQRVAMGRAIVRDPEAFLMDEPLSNLDAKLRVQMRAEISRIQRTVGATTLYVTHDQVEAMTMGDRVAVMRRGRAQQIASPIDVYRAPANLFVASFVGSPSMNIVRAGISASSGHDGVDVLLAGETFRLPADVAKELALPRGGGEVALGIRPEDLRDAPQDSDFAVAARVELVEALGSEVLVYADVAAPPVATEDVLEVAQDIDEAAVDTLASEANAGQTSFVGRLGADSTLRDGDEARLYFDPRRLHFFDLATGRSLRVGS